MILWKAIADLNIRLPSLSGGMITANAPLMLIADCVNSVIKDISVFSTLIKRYTSIKNKNVEISIAAFNYSVAHLHLI